MSASDVAAFLGDFDEEPVGASAADFLLPSSDDEKLAMKRPTAPVNCHADKKKTTKHSKKKSKMKKPPRPPSSESDSEESDSDSFDPIAAMNSTLAGLSLSSTPSASIRATVQSISSGIAAGSVNKTYRQLPVQLRLGERTSLSVE
jgi:hypothetical protein